MNNENLSGAFNVDKLDADAVCAQCNTVNAEGILLCKVCGNNLRDQRTRRLQADQALDMEHTGQRKRAWLSGVFFVVALLLIISTLLNQEMIVDWVIDAQTPSDSSVAVLWSRDYNDYFQPLLKEIEQAALTAETAAAALETPVASEELEGLYALYDGDHFLGSASFRIEGEEAYFAARLDNGEEARGIARIEADHFAALPEYTAMTGDRGQRFSLTGMAMPEGNGVLACKGNNGTEWLSFTAYRIPDS